MEFPAAAKSASAVSPVIPGPNEAPCQMGYAKSVVPHMHDCDGFGCAKWVRQKGRIQRGVVNDSPGIFALAATAENGRCRMGWIGHVKHCEMAVLLWRAEGHF
jgi:hypothetical protein